MPTTKLIRSLFRKLRAKRLRRTRKQSHDTATQRQETEEPASTIASTVPETGTPTQRLETEEPASTVGGAVLETATPIPDPSLSEQPEEQPGSSPESPGEKEEAHVEEGEEKSATSDTVTQEEGGSCDKEEEKYLAPEHQECFICPFRFHQPAFWDEDFDLKVLKSKVSLEYCFHGHNKFFSGFVLVHNEAYHKRVFIRYTHDNWATFNDEEAEWVCSEGASDRFVFSLQMVKTDFAICYVINAQEYWDNNFGHNYHVRPC